MTENVPAVVMMNAEEAQAEHNAAKADTYRALDRLANIRDREGWKALRYESWDAYCTQAWGWTRNYANKLIDYEGFKGELEAVVGTIVPGLTEGGSRAARKQRKATLAKVRKRTEGLSGPAAAEAARAVITEAAAPKAQKAQPEPTGSTPDRPAEKRTANFEAHPLTSNLVDPEWSQFMDLVRAEGVTRDAMATRCLLRGLAATIGTAKVLILPADLTNALVDQALASGESFETTGVRILRAVLETGEVPTITAPKANGKRLLRAAEAAANGDDHRHVAGKPKASGLIFCEECGIPKIGDKWRDENGAAPSPARAVAAREARRAAERFVEPNFKGGKK